MSVTNRESTQGGMVWSSRCLNILDQSFSLFLLLWQTGCPVTEQGGMSAVK